MNNPFSDLVIKNENLDSAYAMLLQNIDDVDYKSSLYDAGKTVVSLLEEMGMRESAAAFDSILDPS